MEEVKLCRRTRLASDVRDGRRNNTYRTLRRTALALNPRDALLRQMVATMDGADDAATDRGASGNLSVSIWTARRTEEGFVTSSRGCGAPEPAWSSARVWEGEECSSWCASVKNFFYNVGLPFFNYSVLAYQPF